MNSRISIFSFLLCAFAAVGLTGTADAGTLRTYYKTPTGTFGGPDASVVDPMTTTTPTQASGKNVTAYPPAGQKLTGWYFYAKSPSGSDQPQGESLGTANPLNVKISEGNDRWLVAHFAWITYKVDYNYAGGSSTGSPSSKLYTDTFNLAAASEKTGYTFSGWKALPVGRTYSAGALVSGEDLCPSDWHEDGETVTLKAQWTAKTYPAAQDGWLAATLPAGRSPLPKNSALPVIAECQSPWSLPYPQRSDALWTQRRCKDERNSG